MKKSDGTYTKIPDDTPFSDESYTTAMVYYEDSPLVSAKYVQTLKKEQTVHVIEIASDLNLGYNLISEDAKKSGLVSNYIKEKMLKQLQCLKWQPKMAYHKLRLKEQMIY